MEVKGYIYLPEEECQDPQTIIAWVTNAYEQGGYYSSLEAAKAHRREYEGLKSKWVLVPISFITGEILTD